ncbi:MAG: ABC transporter permease subunit, partial [Planctomycetes bacterium]|nr:ABC transporter permease subunit [Planctomycetota bacterium]
MTRTLVLFRKELGTYFSSPTAYIILTFYLLLTGFFFYSSLNNYSQEKIPGHYEDTLSIITFLTVLVTPLITMRLIAEEKNKGTIETLVSTPLTDSEIVISKFLSALFFYCFLLIPTFVHVLLLSKYAVVDPYAVLSGYCGIILIAGALFSIGLLISSLCSNQVTAGIITLAVSLVFIFAHAATANLSKDSILRAILVRLSLIQNSEPFVRGIIDSRPTIYFLTFIATALYLSKKSLS